MTKSLEQGNITSCALIGSYSEMKLDLADIHTKDGSTKTK